MRVEVTQEDIDKARHCSSNCPIENALIRNFCYASVGRVIAFITDSGNVKRFSMPLEATQFVISYDMDHEVEPTTFDMEECQ